MPPIAQILARLGELAQAKYADNKTALGALGRAFTESADTNPNYFAVPGRVPEGNLQRLAAKHGVQLNRTGYDDAPGVAASLKGDTAYLTHEDTMGSLLKKAGGYGHEGQKLINDMSRAMKAGQLTPHTDLYGIDMMNAGAGRGTAKQMYPALYEYLLAQPDAANMAFSGLSVNNMNRRSPHMSGAMEKFGDIAGNRLRIDNDQISPVGGPPREAEYHRLATPEKVGLLNAITAPATVDQVGSTLRRLRDQHKGVLPPPWNVGELMDEAHSLGVHEGVWTPSTDVEKEYFPRLAELLGNITQGTVDPNRILGSLPRTVGTDSLRRAAITYDHVGGGLTANDLAAQPYLTDRLARKDGGSIPGPLSQVCACEEPEGH